MSEHSLLWNEDGNLVIQAKSINIDSNTVLFKVHRLLLEKHSEVFKNLFALPDPADAEQYLGTPMIRLEDSAEDLESLFMLFYHYDYLFGVPESDIPVKLVGAIALSEKYMMDSVLRTVLKRVASPWPRTLEDFDLKDAQAAVFRRKFKSDPFPHLSVHGWPESFLPEPVQALVIAEQYHLDDILPAIYYDLARCSVTADWDARFTSDGDMFAANCMENGKAARWKLFPLELAMKLYRTRAVLEDITQTILRRFKPYIRLYDCECSEETHFARPSKIREIASKHHIADPLSSIRDCTEELYRDDKGREWCYKCRQGFEVKLRELKDMVWVKVKEQISL